MYWTPTKKESEQQSIQLISTCQFFVTFFRMIWLSERFKGDVGDFPTIGTYKVTVNHLVV